MGECWSDKASGDGTHEIFISPVLSDPVAVYAVLMGQLAHTLAGCEGTGAKYRTVCGLLHLGAPWSSPTAGQGWPAANGNAIDSLGAYPHAAITMSSAVKQGTRMLRLSCSGCGYILRTTQRWVNEGLPTCHCGTTFSL